MTAKAKTAQKNAPSRRLVLALALLLFASTPLVVLAQFNGPFASRLGAAGGDGFAPGMILKIVKERIADELELTEAQRQEIRALLETRRDEVRESVSAAVEARRGLFAAIHGERFDEIAIREASQQTADAQLDLALLRGEIVQDVRDVLTPDQQEEARELLEAFSQRFEGLSVAP